MTQIERRNTSTDVEKTSARSAPCADRWKHLHGRGEDARLADKAECNLETPPRTWRRLTKVVTHAHKAGNTSTDVEKTKSSVTLLPRQGKHLHGRGEDQRPVSFVVPISETPPRTWRRRVMRFESTQKAGNTSTDVEKTISVTLMALSYGETPPRTWRRLLPMRPSSDGAGNTSTDVEKTYRTYRERGSIEKHLHGRGEDNPAKWQGNLDQETPPRTWRRPVDACVDKGINGNTSTDVEKTARFSIRLIQPTLLFVVVVVKGGYLTN